MLERLIILSLVSVGSVVTYRLFQQWQLWQVRAVASTLKSDLPTIMLFTADYCYPCKTQQLPAIDRLKTEVGENSLRVIQVDVEAEPELAEQWGVMSLPTTFILDGDGKPRRVNHGVTSTEILKQQLEGLV